MLLQWHLSAEWRAEHQVFNYHLLSLYGVDRCQRPLQYYPDLLAF